MPDSQNFHVIIIGGGLGGLSLAQSLRRGGISFELFERDRSLFERPQGYRLHLDADAIHTVAEVLTPELRALFEATAQRTEPFTAILKTDLSVLKRLPTPDEDDASLWTGGAPPAGHRNVDRATLRQILLAQIEDRIRYGKTLNPHGEPHHPLAAAESSSDGRRDSDPVGGGKQRHRRRHGDALAPHISAEDVSGKDPKAGVRGLLLISTDDDLCNHERGGVTHLEWSVSQADAEAGLFYRHAAFRGLPDTQRSSVERWSIESSIRTALWYRSPSNTATSKNALRRLLKFIHTLGAAGLVGGICALAVVVILTPASTGTIAYVALMRAMVMIAAWIIGPSMVLTVVAGLLAIAAHPPFQDAGWVWAKAATGILILEGGLHVMGPIQEEAKRAAGALGGHPHPTSMATLLTAEGDTLWLLLAVSVANIALGVWRPRLSTIFT